MKKEKIFFFAFCAIFIFVVATCIYTLILTKTNYTSVCKKAMDIDSIEFKSLTIKNILKQQHSYYNRPKFGTGLFIRKECSYSSDWDYDMCAYNMRKLYEGCNYDKKPDKYCECYKIDRDVIINLWKIADKYCINGTPKGNLQEILDKFDPFTEQTYIWDSDENIFDENGKMKYFFKCYRAPIITDNFSFVTDKNGFWFEHSKNGKDNLYYHTDKAEVFCEKAKNIKEKNRDTIYRIRIDKCGNAREEKIQFFKYVEE